jgi:hypothetical protein
MRDTKAIRVPRRSGEAGLYTVPRWDELAADPSKAGVLDARTAHIVATKALGIFVASLCRLLEPAGGSDLSDPIDRAFASEGLTGSSSRTVLGFDDVMPIEEVAQIIGKPRGWIIRNGAKFPFVTRLSRKHYIGSRIALRRWLATRPCATRRE